MGEAWQDFNRTEAFKGLEAIRDINFSTDLPTYPLIQKLTVVNDTANASEVSSSIFTPITDYWASDAVYGSWFYVLLIILTVGAIYIKSQNLHRTSIAMLLMGLLATVPGTAGLIYIPVSALYTLYILTALAVCGVLYSAAGD